MRILIYLTLVFICLTLVFFSGCIDRYSSVRINPVPNQTIFSMNINTTESVNDILAIHNSNTNTTESDPFIGYWYSSYGNRILLMVYPNGNITIYSGDHAIIHQNGKWIKTGDNTYFFRILESDTPVIIKNNVTISYNSKTNTLFNSDINDNRSWERIDRPTP